MGLAHDSFGPQAQPTGSAHSPGHTVTDCHGSNNIGGFSPTKTASALFQSISCSGQHVYAMVGLPQNRVWPKIGLAHANKLFSRMIDFGPCRQVSVNFTDSCNANADSFNSHLEYKTVTCIYIRSQFIIQLYIVSLKKSN